MLNQVQKIAVRIGFRFLNKQGGGRILKQGGGRIIVE